MADEEIVREDAAYWRDYRAGIDRAIMRARGVVPSMQQAAVWVGALIVIGVFGTVAAIWAEDSDLGLQALLAAAIALPALLLFPTCAWGLGALIDVQAWRLDLASLEADLEEAVGE